MVVAKMYIPQCIEHRGSARMAMIALLLPCLFAAPIGCGRSAPTPPFAMAQQAESGHGVWWSTGLDGVEGDAAVIGIEQRVAASRVRLWLIDKRGVRIFDLRNGRMTGWSTPLSTDDPVGDFSLMRSLARGKLGWPAGSGWPGPPLPADEVDRLHILGDLLTLLSRTWPDTRINPPESTTGRRIQQALGEGALSIDDLLQYGM